MGFITGMQIVIALKKITQYNSLYHHLNRGQTSDLTKWYIHSHIMKTKQNKKHKKNFQQLVIEKFLSLVKAICEKSTDKIILKRKTVKCFSSNQEQGCQLSSFTFNITLLENLASAIRQEKEMVRHALPNGTEEVKLSLFTEDRIIYVKNIN